MARLKKGRDSESFCLSLMTPCEYAFKASSEDVVASARGVANFSTVLSDSPSSRAVSPPRPRAHPRLFLSRPPRLLLRQHLACLAVHRIKPNHILIAQSSDKASNVSLTVRPLAHVASHLGVIRVSAGRVINFNVAPTFSSGTILRKGDWRRLMLSACFSVSSKTVSPFHCRNPPQ